VLALLDERRVNLLQRSRLVNQPAAGPDVLPGSPPTGNGGERVWREAERIVREATGT